jgi:hypothetical protein
MPAYPITRTARNDGSSFAAQIRDAEGDDQRANEPRETFRRSLIPPANDTIKGIQAMVNARLLTVVEEDNGGWKA